MPQRPNPLTIVEEIRADLGEASALVPLGARRFLVADDEHGVRLVDAGGAKVTSTLLIDAQTDDRVAGLEGMCRVNDQILAVREQDGLVVSFPVPSPAEKRPMQVETAGTLARPPASPGKRNKGYEGIAFLPAKSAYDGRDHILAVHEGFPRALCLFSWPALKLEQSIEMSGALATALPDVSDVAVHPESGELWMLTDEGERIVRVTITKGALQLVQSHDIPVEDGEKPEGIAFDEDGALWLVTDDTGRLLRLGI